VRSIVYLALQLAQVYANQRNILSETLGNISIENWEEIDEVKPYLNNIANAVDEVLVQKLEEQIPFLMQPIWKTDGKSQILSEQCFDMFIWKA
jgi:hypothetical protein